MTRDESDDQNDDDENDESSPSTGPNPMISECLSPIPPRAKPLTLKYGAGRILW